MSQILAALKKVKTEQIPRQQRGCKLCRLKAQDQENLQDLLRIRRDEDPPPTWHDCIAALRECQISTGMTTLINHYKYHWDGHTKTQEASVETTKNRRSAGQAKGRKRKRA